MAALKRLLMIGAVALLAWLAWDFLYIGFGLGTGDSHPVLAGALLSSVCGGFLWASWPLFPARPLPWQLVGRLVTAALATAVWLIAATVIFLQFHIAIGGGL